MELAWLGGQGGRAMAAISGLIDDNDVLRKLAMTSKS
jgi:hypothetical protein